MAWRLHYLWYLEDIAGNSSRMAEVIAAMATAEEGVLNVDRLPADFTRTHASCTNILRRELGAMERFLFGEVRPLTERYIDEFDRFVHRFGDVSDVRDASGALVWERTRDRQGNPLPAAHAGSLSVSDAPTPASR